MCSDLRGACGGGRAGRGPARRLYQVTRGDHSTPLGEVPRVVAVVVELGVCLVGHAALDTEIHDLESDRWHEALGRVGRASN